MASSGDGVRMAEVRAGAHLPLAEAALYGPVTVTSHAYLSSLATILFAAAVDTAARLEAPPPLSAAR